MAGFNGSGVFLRLYNWVNDAAANIKIRADRMDAEFNGIATGLTNCITKDGQTTVTANLPMSGFKHTGVDDASASDEYASYGQLTTALAAITLDSLSNVVLTSTASSDFIQFDGTNWINKKHLSKKGTSIASATTTDIGAADSDFIDVTGTTTITSLGSTTTRDHVWVNFTGALTLTHNATSLILPTGANITTANGDIAEFVRVSGSNWKCVSYNKNDGSPLILKDNTVTYAKIDSSIFATVAEMLSGTVSKILNAANFKTYLDTYIFGVGQTLQDVTASRAINTTYTNSTSKPITVYFRSTASSNPDFTVYIGGVAAVDWAVGAAGRAGFCFIVPAGATYQIFRNAGTSGVTSWLELR